MGFTFFVYVGFVMFLVGVLTSNLSMMNDEKPSVNMKQWQPEFIYLSFDLKLYGSSDAKDLA